MIIFFMYIMSERPFLARLCLQDLDYYCSSYLFLFLIIILIIVIVKSLSFIYPSVSSTKAFTPTIVVVKKDKPDQSTGRQELLLSKRNSQRVAEVLTLYTPF